MNARKLGLSAAVGALVLLNLWRWWPEAPEAARPARVASVLSPADFAVQGWAPGRVAGQPRRDLFFDASRPAPPVPSAPAEPKPAAPQPTPQALARDRAREEFGTFRLEGVLSRRGRWEAFVSKGEERYTVAAGSIIQGRYVVETVDAQGAVLRERGSNLVQRIGLNGKE